MPKILVASNDQDLLDILTETLQGESFEVAVATEGVAVQETAEAERPALILLDLQISGMDGLSICRDIRSVAGIVQTPIIALTSDEEDSAKAAPLNAGADDCMVKPFNPEELLARINAVLRHTAPPTQSNSLCAGPIEMDIDRWMLRVEGRTVEITAKEFHLLRELLQAKGRVLPRETLLQRVWEHVGAERIDTRTVDVHVGRLRRKLGRTGRHIITVRNVGYRLDIFPNWTNGDARE